MPGDDAVRTARVGILADERTAAHRRAYGVNVFASAYEDMLAHRGIPFTVVSSLSQLGDAHLDLVLVAATGGHAAAGHGAGDSASGTHADALIAYAAAGGIVVGCGDIGIPPRELGYVAATPVGPGYASFRDTEERFSHLADLVNAREELRLRFLAAEPWVARTPSVATSVPHRRAAPAVAAAASGIVVAPGHATTYGLLHEVTVGRGVVARFAVDIAETVVVLRQGRGPVLCDGVPAPDGSADVDDGVLKADDAIALDWTADRRRSSTGIPFFPFAYADWWRELLVGYLVRVAWDRGLALPFTDYWPSQSKAAVMISHDSDGNVDDHAVTTLDLLAEHDVRSSWCLLEPGFSPEICRRARGAGHEIAFHYNAVPEDGGSWGGTEFARQLDRLRRTLPGIDLVANKNHLTRVEGWGELFAWCEAAGIRSDQTFGPSKKGNLGFPFATCHPYRPVAWFTQRNRLYDVLEMGFLSPDMNTGKWGDESLIEPILQAVTRAHGLAHFLFHQVHLHEREAVRRAFASVIREARERGLPFMTGDQVDEWQRFRRRVRLAGAESGGIPMPDSRAHGRGLTVLVPVSARDAEHTGTVRTCYGVPCVVITR